MNRFATRTSMPAQQQSGQVSMLPRGRSMSWTATAPAQLQVLQGRLWVTRSATDAANEDEVLSAGDRLCVAAGERLVLESWSDARWRVVAQAAPTARARWSWARWRRLWSHPFTRRAPAAAPCKA